MKLPITSIILTYNEELNLSNCLKSIKKYIPEIIVVDSGSTDRTVEIAKKYGAKVVINENYQNQAQQFNWALDNVEVNNPWIFRLDADEWVTKELMEELAEKLPETPEEISGFYIKRRVYFMGKWIKHGGYYPTWFLRLFRTDKGRSEEREMDEHIILKEGKTARLKNDFADENHKDLEAWTAKHNDYSTREVRAREKEAKGTKKDNLKGQARFKRVLKKSFYGKLPLFCRAFIYYIYRYIIRLGFLDGKEGLIYHTLQGFWHQFLIDAKIYEKRRKNK